MPDQYISLDNLRFLLHEVLEVEKLTQHEYYKEYSKENIDMVLEAGLQIGDNYLRPLLTEMDRNEPQLVEGKIRVHPKMREIVEMMGRDGWISSIFPYEAGGMQLPVTVNSALTFILNAANYSASVFSFLTTGAAGLLYSFADKSLQERYLPPMFAGKWQGTMALTEPGAGSSLSDIITTAEPTEEGYYHIKGQKIYISCGDHDACDNVVHLMLAKIKGGPAGAKGISLFVVPQKRITNEGNLESNDVSTAGVYHKMGYKGAPIAHLMMGEREDCRGWLVGEPHKGLSYMFQMMNEARIGVGMNACGIASAAYYASLDYAKVRPQGRKINNKDISLPQVPIIEHADVKRMLLMQKAIVEGSLALLLQCSFYADLEKVSEGETKEEAFLLLDFLTPIAKSYPSEMGILSTSAGVQILGGGGYLKDFTLEQYYREMRIHPIHEGTTAIHGIDLLGRKVTMHNGKAAELFVKEITKTIEKAKSRTELQPWAQKLERFLQQWQHTTQQLLSIAKTGETEQFLADATLYLEYTGILTIAWQWLKQTTVAIQKNHTLAESKLYTLRYFFGYELNKMEGLALRLLEKDMPTVEMPAALF